ncbi:acetyl xylanesterase [Colletotrichum kahawae]|uniref:Acetyl xylanesterase n=1 Tax=Colletotrichum kahawae TaxID=34407 RepID=A0AAD9YRV9_COLKA|nr:acetyl xylanesterase [Colletotrichum kahawae]
MVPSPVVALGFLGALQGGGSSLVQRQATGCATGVHMIVARASTERPGTGIIGEVATKVQAQIPGSDITPVDYPAQLNPYQPSQKAGVDAMTKLVQDYAKQCPQTKMVLMGYSQVGYPVLAEWQKLIAMQGAHVTADVLCGTSESGFAATPAQAADVTDKISAVVLMGDPSHVVGQPFNTGTSQKDGVFPRQDNAACGAVASKMTSFCDTGDPFCDSGANLQVHLGYVTRNGDDAVKFIVDKVNGAGAAGGAKNGTA